ncbi:hypothetical protein PR202_ga14621 [Eleusine coracana subsp. coracana]|uniref:Reverse transcriptase zinc-binding domain-containing protein n=1 Tax=Eleusine coracana subsp. coracana TaxID=191504 RepID=A0AAV5CHR3_ELECO|nr:hypothetical protein PR202_ga14621 [Eleusine coracana subsp. coracana]
MVPKRVANKRTVAEAMENFVWTGDIHGVATPLVIDQFLQLCDVSLKYISRLQAGMQDSHIWRLSPSEQYTASSAYEALFQGSTSFEPFERIWRTWAPGKCKFFLWLAAHNRCWTADRLARRNMPHPSHCLLCDQEEETINHLLVGCVFARQFWLLFLQRIRLGSLAPQPLASSFQNWWQEAIAAVHTARCKGLNSLIILGAWALWHHRNWRVTQSPCCLNVRQG